MSPHRTPGTAKDSIIRKLTPSMMRAFQVERPLAIVLLLELSPEQRSFLWEFHAKAMGRKSKGK